MRLLLVGAGHAHLEILRRLAEERPAGVELTLLSPEPRQVYSGMVPGYLAGTYALDEISVPVEPLAARAGGRLVEGRAAALDSARRIVRLEDGRELAYDLAAFAVGSNTAGIDRPGVADHAAPIKPLGRVVELREKIESLAREPEAERTAAVVGGGAAGTEVALALRAALGPGAKIHLLEAGSRVLSEYPERFRARALAALAGKGIEVLAGTPVARVGPHSATLEDGREIPAALTIWLAGAVGWPLFRDSGLPLDDRGFLLLDDSLRSVADPKIFAAGDCGTLASHPETPKAGVYAVREAPVLWGTLLAALRHEEPPRYQPQCGFLSLLNLGDGRALLHWKGLVGQGRWAFRLKDWIDRRFVGKYR